MPLLSWYRRDEDLTRAALAPFRLLEPVASQSYGDEDAPNMLIQGDNLDALKALLPYYAGQVKCIFIDPPYNTTNDFDHYDDNLAHSQWLSMIYPRLELLRQLLREDGSIWVTLDDNESHYFKTVADEIFGRKNFIATVIWQKIYSPKNSARHFSVDHDYMLIYAKNADKWVPNPMPRTEKQDNAYKNRDKDPRGPWKAGDLSARNYYGAGTYPITTPSGRVIAGPPNGMYWRVSEPKLRQLDGDNRIWWGTDGGNVPAIKRFLSEVKQGRVPQTLWPYEEVGHTQDAKKEIVALFGDDVFGTPKPERLIKRVIDIATNPGDLVLDSFLGSGTTAAVAQKMGRRWIGIEVGEHARTHCVPRLTKVVQGEQGGVSKDLDWHGGGGFRFFKLGPPVFDENGHIREGIKFEHLAAHVWFAETGTPRSTRANASPYLGEHGGVGYYLLYNGILGDERATGGNVLTKRLLKSLPVFDGPKVIYGEASMLDAEQLRELDIVFKQTPYDLKGTLMSLALKLYQKRALDTLGRFLETARTGVPADAFAKTVDEGLITAYKPLPRREAVPYVCLRIPTGGGKTVMGAHIIQTAGVAYLDRPYPLVLWLVPTTQIKNQTLEAFRDHRHPYRLELDDAFDGQVAVFDIGEFSQIRPADLVTRVCLVIATVASLRVNDTEGRNVYKYNEHLEPHFGGDIQHLDYLERGDDGKVLASFANLLALHKPLIITDEAHNATTPLSYDVYDRLNPNLVIELTATPDAASSNVLVSVSAFELKAENMIKFPVVLKEHNGQWQAAVGSAVARRNALAKIAVDEAEYIRPILLIQAENARGTATVEEVRRHLIEDDGVAEKAIAVATGDVRGIEGVDLFANDCPIEVIITKQALKEGWDCSFAYVFCSVAQVKSDKDIQQLLGRVLRMPYATKRKQEAMSKAYAHVVSPTFGAAAHELTEAMVRIGFNPLEVARAIEAAPDQAKMPLDGGQTGLARELPAATFEVSREPDLSAIPERDRERVTFVPNEAGRGGTVEIRDLLDEATKAAVIAAVPASKRPTIEETIEHHQLATLAIKAPSERGQVFSVPRLYVVEQGELELADRGMVMPNFSWDLLNYPADLSSFAFNDDSKTFEVYLDGAKVQYHPMKDDAATYLPGFAQDRTLTDLLGWLDHEVREPSIKQPMLREWVRKAIERLTRDRGFSLAQLLKGQYVLRRKLREQLDIAKATAYKAGFQQALFEGEVVASSEPGFEFTYPADMTAYPAHSYYMGGTYRFEKHYYPVPGDLKWKTDGGRVTEEFLCAQVLDLMDEVEYWVRNLVNPSQFWMPTSRQRTYPDFVARLLDGRLLVVEYKGADRFTNDDSEEKRNVGELWAMRSGGKGVYVMVQMADAKGLGMREQILTAIRM